MKDQGRSNNSSGLKSSEIVCDGQLNSEEDPFAEYMWMENEEEFNKQVVEELWEEEFIERCFQEMLEEEEEHEWFIPARDLPQVTSKLNPEAKEFVPGVKHSCRV